MIKKLFSNLVVRATDGTQTFESAGFSVGLGTHHTYKSTPGRSSRKALVNVGKITRPGGTAEAFESFAGRKRRRWRGENQIGQFCIEHKDRLGANCHNLFELSHGFYVSVEIVNYGPLKLFANVYLEKGSGHGGEEMFTGGNPVPFPRIFVLQ
ncbi:hypothetical protein A2917_01135 [Candidatus Nomurabacteria bacterium RIFCSPLOWO2_01_FULL_42_17]|uniref:Uncharacterized protein n=1 Tax=Candidatus Nomurabacteria bacterium RIFCSPLOWO2_01_FULL_42_17 TaxID=1801780 RepID=A0A1F6XNY0_9BACT|nr:MAG: hypothetical protein A2917_01135 [Candidatus Nomurabacteria bacterium RIFCSPLOWO2_01_FULL_42_17]